MRKIITIFLFISIPLLSSAQVTLESGFGLAYSPAEKYKVDSKAFSLDNITALNQMRLKYSNFMLVSNITVMMQRTPQKLTFAPSLASFDLELIYVKNKFTFVLAHRCVHPISVYSKPLAFEIYGGYNVKVKMLYNIK